MPPSKSAHGDYLILACPGLFSAQGSRVFAGGLSQPEWLKWLQYGPTEPNFSESPPFTLPKFIGEINHTFDVIKHNQLEVRNINSKIEQNKARNVFHFLLFLASFNCFISLEPID